MAEIELIKSTARKRGTEETHLKTIQKRNNGNPKRIWLQWHSNGNIGKAHPLSSAFLILFLYFLPALLLQSDPAVVGKGGGHKTGSTQTYSFAHDVETGLSRMTLAVPECTGNCRWCWDARNPPPPPFAFSFFAPANLDRLPRGSDPEVVVAHVCFLGCLTCERRQSRGTFRSRGNKADGASLICSCKNKCRKKRPGKKQKRASD